MSRRIPSLLVTSAAVLATTATAASADGGSLLSGYAPSGAGEEIVLGSKLPVSAPAPASRPTVKTDLALALPRRPVAAPATGTVAKGRTAGRSNAPATVPHKRVSSPALNAVAPVAVSTRAVAAAARGSAGSLLGTRDILVGGLVLGAALGLAMFWRRQEQ